MNCAGGSPDQLDAALDELYRVPPAQFVAARDAKAAQLRQAGDTATAKTVKGLRRPAVSAWLANLLTRERPGEIDQLLTLGALMREAQSRLAGEQLRELTRRRQQVVAALGREARTLAGAAGLPVGTAVQRELAVTLEAALADPAAGEVLRSGRLSVPLTHAGFPLSEGIAGVPPAPAPSPAPVAGDVEGGARPAGAGCDLRADAGAGGNLGAYADADGEAEVRQAAERRRAAEERLTAAEHELDVAAGRVEAGRAVLARIDGRSGEIAAAIGKLEDRLGDLRAEQAAVDTERGPAQVELETAERQLQSAGEAVARARRNLDHFDRL